MLEQGHNHNNNGSKAIHHEAVQYFSADDTVLGTITKAVRGGKDISLRLDSLGAVHILGSRGMYYSALSAPERFFSVEPSRFKSSHPGPRDIEALERNGCKLRPVRELLWTAAHYGSRGRLLEGMCQSIDVVELTAWPNMTRWPVTEHGMAIASLLRRHPSSMMLAGRLLNIPVGEMCTFYTAARVAGMAKPINRKELPTESPAQLQAHRNRSFLAKLFARASEL